MTDLTAPRRSRSRTGRLAGAAAGAGRGAARVVGLAAAVAQVTQRRLRRSTTTLQTFPDSTLRGLAATSFGVGTGFYLAGKPRVVIAAGIAPAMLAAIAIIGRPIRPLVSSPTRGRRSRRFPFGTVRSI